MRRLPALIVLCATSAATSALAQTVVVGGEGRNQVDVNYEVLDMMGPPPDGAPPQGQPAYQPQAPAYQQPAPTYQQPAPAYQQPAPAYQQPAPAYQQPAPVYQQPAPAYQQPAPAYQPAPQPVQRNIRVQDLPFDVGPLTAAETADGFDSVTVVGSPSMETQAQQTGQIKFTQGTHQLVGSLRDQVSTPTQPNAGPPIKVTTAKTSTTGPEMPFEPAGPAAQPAPMPYQPAPAPYQPAPAPYQPAPAPMQPDQSAMAPQPMAPAPAPVATQDPADLDAAPESWQQSIPAALLQQASQAPSGNPAFATIVFPPESAAITPVAEQQVGAAARKVITTGGTIEVVSRTPTTTAGDRDALRLSLRRAIVVRNTLVNQGVPEAKIQIRSLVSVVNSDADVQSRELNRVELVRL